MQIGSLVVLLICLAASLYIFIGCMAYLLDAMEYQHLLILSIINMVMAMLASFEVGRDVSERIITPVIMVLYGIAVLTYQSYFGTFSGIIHTKTYYKCIHFPFGIIGMVIMVNHCWLSVISDSTGIINLDRDQMYSLSVKGDSVFVLYMLVVMMIIIADGIRFYIDNRRKKPLRKRAEFMIFAMVVMAVLFVISSILQRSGVLVVASTFVSSIIYYLCGRIGAYNTEAMAANIMVKNMSDAVVIINQKGKFVRANPVAQKLFPEIKDAVPHQSDIAGLFEGKEGSRIQSGLKTYEITEDELYNKELFIGTVVVARDVTQEIERIKNAEAHREKAIAEARWNYYLMGSASHAIRTPLNVIIGTVDMAIQTEPTPQQISYLRQISRFSWQLVKRIDMFMNMMCTSGIAAEQKVENYKLNEKLYDMTGVAKFLLRGKDIDFKVNVNPSMPNGLNGNISLISVAAVNVLSNAAKYTDSGTITVDVDYEPVSGGKIKFTGKVTDTGRGIREEDKERIFGIFQRAENTEDVTGFGIGLYSVKEAIDLLGGVLTIESEYGKGSCFSMTVEQDIFDGTPIGNFDMNIDPYADEEDAIPENMYSYQWPGASALIVDDMDVNIEILDWMLSLYGLNDIKVAKRFEDAMRLYKENDFDIIFLDYMMDDVNGIYMMERMKDAGEKKSKFVVVTADSREESRDFYRKTFDGYLWKPIRRYRLEFVLNKLLPKNLRVEANASDNVEPGKNYLLPIFVKEVRRTLELILKRLNEGDYIKIAGAIHGIKGACMELGFKDFAKYAQYIEMDLRNGHRQNAYEIITEFCDRANRLLERLEAAPEDHVHIPAEEVPENSDVFEVRITYEWIEKVQECLYAFDYDNASAMMVEAKNQLDSVNAGIIADAIEELEDLEYEKAADILESLKERTARK